MSMIYEDKFRKGVKAFRERAHLTIPQAAERIGTSTQMIEWWEKGERTPNLRIFYTICAAYQCSPNDLLGWHSHSSANVKDVAAAETDSQPH
jgi:transcriptional regulator with XRE-family HTH domain